MATDKIEPLLSRLRQLGHGGNAGDYKVFKREDDQWVIQYNDLTLLQAKSRIGLYNALVAYHRGYWQGLQDVQKVRETPIPIHAWNLTRG